MSGYKNLDLIFSQDDDGSYYISIQNPLSKEGVSRRFDLPFSWIEIDNFIKEIESLPKVDRNILEYFGSKLFASVFSNNFLDCYSRYLQATEHMEGININLIWEKEEQLARIPWELMFDGKNFISCSMRTPVIRYIGGYSPASSSEIRFPVRILFVVSKPLASKPLNLGGQVRHIFKSLNNYIEEGCVEIHCLTGREFYRPDLIQSIKEGKYHILHISGHGKFHERLDKVFLKLEDGSGQGFELSVGTLASWVQDSEIRFVYLDACQTAIATKKRFPVWHDLFNSGVRGVLGMQLSISEEAATKFSEAFYSQIMKGKTVQAAVSYSRTSLVSERFEYEIAEWAIPVLYTSTYDILKISGDKKSRERYKTLDTNQIFIGRQDYLDRITEGLIDANNRIVLINGFGGIGKSALAREIVSDLRGHYDDICWIDPREVKGFDAIISEINSMLMYHDIGIPEEEFQKNKPAENIREIAKKLDKKRFLIIFDNFEIIEKDALVLEIIKEIDKKEHTSVLITTRIEKNVGRRQKSIQLLKLPEEDAFLLMRRLARNQGIQEIENAKDKILKDINSRVDGHPKAIEVVIPRFRSLAVELILRELPKVIGSDITPILEWTYEKLNETQKIIIRRISIFVAEVGYEELAAINKDVDILNEIQALVSNSLVNFDASKNKYSLHALVHDFVYAKLENKEKIHLQSSEYYLSLPFPEKRDKKDDVQTLIEAHYHACMAKEYDKAAGIIFDCKLNEDLDRWGNYYTLIDLYQKILPKDPFQDKPLLSSKKINGIAIGYLGTAYFYLGEIKKAIGYYEKALKIAQETEDRRYEGHWLGDLGNTFTVLEGTEKAIEYYEKALKIAQEIGDEQNESFWLGDLGTIYSTLGKNKKAIEYYEKALKISQEIGDRTRESMWLTNLGFIYSKQGKSKKAIEYYEKGLKIAQEIGARPEERLLLNKIGDFYLRRGNVREAISYIQKALKIAQEIGGNTKDVGYTLRSLGIAYSDLGDEKNAIDYYEKALKIAQKIGERQLEGRSLGSLGVAYYYLGDGEKAIQYYEKALKIAQEIGDRRFEGHWLGDIGLVYSVQGEVGKAIRYHIKALKIAQEIGDRRHKGLWLNHLGTALTNERKYTEALACYLLAKDIRTQIEDPNLKTTESIIENFKKDIGENEFERLTAEVAPKAEEIVRKIIGESLA